jgi:hypothetical protein
MRSLWNPKRRDGLGVSGNRYLVSVGMAMVCGFGLHVGTVVANTASTSVLTGACFSGARSGGGANRRPPPGPDRRDGRRRVGDEAHRCPSLWGVEGADGLEQAEPMVVCGARRRAIWGASLFMCSIETAYGSPGRPGLTDGVSRSPLAKDEAEARRWPSVKAALRNSCAKFGDAPATAVQRDCT